MSGPGPRLIPLAFVAVALLLFSGQGDALSCNVGGRYEIHNPSAFPKGNLNVSAFLDEMGITERDLSDLPPLHLDQSFFAGITSRDCDGDDQGKETFACLDARFCHAAVDVVAKFCIPLDYAKEEMPHGCLPLLIDEENGWQVEICSCTETNCNQRGKNVAGICADVGPSFKIDFRSGSGARAWREKIAGVVAVSVTVLLVWFSL